MYVGTRLAYLRATETVEGWGGSVATQHLRHCAQAANHPAHKEKKLQDM
jgi:hypothetical protein